MGNVNLPQEQEDFESASNLNDSASGSISKDQDSTENKDENNENQSTSNQIKITYTRFLPKCIVKELSNLNEFVTSVETLSEILEKDYNDVLNVINSNHRIFSTMTDDSSKVLVELNPKIGLCYYHIALGCTQQKCLSLHICEEFINDKCEISNCSFGHIWKTEHNILVLKEFCIVDLPYEKLHKLMKKVLDKEVFTGICSDYSENKCKLDEKCNNFHICYSYINNLGNCNNGENCLFSHDIQNSNCLAILKRIGISTNESGEDLLKLINDRCLSGKGEAKNEIHVSLKQGESIQSSYSSIFHDIPSEIKIDTCDEQNNGNLAITDEEHGPEIKKIFPSQTNESICCWHFHGNVDKPNICKQNINKMCRLARCKYLHCDHKSHWQFGSDDISWYNFNSIHSKLLDHNYSDVNCDSMVLPMLNPTKVNDEQTSLFILMGKGNAKIDFANMKMDCEEVEKMYDIRHLTTDSSTISDDIENTEFKWYFLENGYKWKLFQNKNFSSHIIEEAYQEQPTGKYEYKTSKFTYSLDFSKMTQTNLKTKTVRYVKRRPVIKQINCEEIDNDFKRPGKWETMNDDEEYRLVALSSGNIEYEEICQMIKTNLPMINIVTMSRIQNPNLWKQYEKGQKEFQIKYDMTEINIKKLFYGINDSKVLQDICRDNIDCRLHDNSSERKLYGDGTYFYTSASNAATKSKIDFNGNKTILVADVIIGTYALGSEGMTQPPFYSVFKGTLYDTTTDNLKNPTVFVKYNKEEYYPSYIVEFN